ncbi:MAG TPA: DedA family protein [Candidatus Udaeobacter sp.]|jgi:membrane protein DedA with SNARE-associated domain|nr:DedA family protein [Candidatus Udaeobacter sp.]
MFHSLLRVWFELTLQWGYLGIFLLMAIESTVFPLPSEVVIPPAAYWATQGRFNFWLVVLAATLGSWAGAALSYAVARAVGRPLILRYGRYVLITEKKWDLAEQWIARYSMGGVFFARMLPVVRHLVSLPAGAARISFRNFSIMTLLGSLVWCTVLAWFGARVLSDQPNLLNDPGALSSVLRTKLMWFVIAVVVLLALYVVMELAAGRLRRSAAVISDGDPPTA